MQSLRKSRSLLVLIVSLATVAAYICAAQQPPSGDAPVDVSGKWTVYTHDDNGKTATKFFDLKQEGEKISGHFKGPNQSGGIEGTIEGRHIVFHTKTRSVLTFRGQVNGNEMQGNYGIHGPRVDMHGAWEARRTTD